MWLELLCSFVTASPHRSIDPAEHRASPVQEPPQLQLSREAAHPGPAAFATSAPVALRYCQRTFQRFKKPETCLVP